MKYIVALAIFIVALAQSIEIPEFVQICKRNDPDHRSCLKSAIQSIVPNLVAGIPEFGVESVDPTFVPEITANYHRGPISVKSLVKNANIYGIANVQVNDVRFNLDEAEKLHLEVDVKFPSLYIEGDYKVEGQLAILPVFGKGRFNNSMTDVSATWALEGKPITKDGQVYMKIEQFGMQPEVGDMKVYFANLFGEDSVLNEATNAFINEFWPFVYHELLPIVSDVWDRIMRTEANKIFLKVPFAELFPEA